MNWSALSPLQAVMLFSAAAGLAVWMYYREKQPVLMRVSTLRFWSGAQVSIQQRRRLRDRSALLAQLLFLLLVILAIADIRQHSDSSGRSFAIVLDTSIAAQVREPGGRTLMELERQEAARLLDSLSENDRVLLLRAEEAPAPMLPFTTDRAALRQAISEAQPSSTVADLPRALSLARTALAGSPGATLIYVGPGMLDAQQSRALETFRGTLNTPGEPKLLARLVGTSTPFENCGITRIALQRDATRPNYWHLLSNITNYGRARQTLDMQVLLDGSSLGGQKVPVDPGQTTSLAHEIRSTDGGLLQLQIGPADALEADNRAVLALPAFRPVHVAIVTADSVFAREMVSVLATHHDVQTEVVAPGARPANAPDIEIHSGTPPTAPSGNSIWFLREQSRDAAASIRLSAWDPQHPVTRWIRTHDVIVQRAAPLAASPEDRVLARADRTRAPLITAREQQGRKTLVIGFDPRYSNLPRQEAFPLLMAGAVEWMTGTTEDVIDFHIAGALTIPGKVTGVVGPSNQQQPFTLSEHGAYLLASETGAYRVQTAAGESVVGVNTPPLPPLRWQPQPQELGTQGAWSRLNAARSFWWWLVILGMALLWLEWWLFYSNPENQVASIPVTRESVNQTAGS
ncbi:MAG: VWA domain-containing protein [Candidatus Korobacteraceae bacterium]